jgi:hypothetical protein
VQVASSLRRIILLSVTCMAVTYFSTLSHKRHDFLKTKKLLSITCVFWHFLQRLSETFLVLRRIQRDVIVNIHRYKGKGLPQQAEVAQGVPGRLRPRISLTLGTKRVVGRQPYASAAFTPGEIPGTHFQRLSRPQGTWLRPYPRKKSPVTPPGIDSGTVRLVMQCLNHYATPGPKYS